jgi:hypothetical protein
MLLLSTLDKQYRQIYETNNRAIVHVATDRKMRCGLGSDPETPVKFKIQAGGVFGI